MVSKQQASHGHLPKMIALVLVYDLLFTKVDDEDIKGVDVYWFLSYHKLLYTFFSVMDKVQLSICNDKVASLMDDIIWLWATRICFIQLDKVIAKNTIALVGQYIKLIVDVDHAPYLAYLVAVVDVVFFARLQIDQEYIVVRCYQEQGLLVVEYLIYGLWVESVSKPVAGADGQHMVVKDHNFVSVSH